MHKPDWCDQETWEKAISFHKGMVRMKFKDSIEEQEMGIIGIIAVAMIFSRNKENEACAKEVEEVILKARLGEIDGDLRCVGSVASSNIRARNPISVYF